MAASLQGAGERIIAGSVARVTRQAADGRRQRQQPDIVRQRQLQQQIQSDGERVTKMMLQNQLVIQSQANQQKERNLTQQAFTLARQGRATVTALGLSTILIWIYGAQVLGAIMFFVGYEIEQGFFTRNAARIFFTSGEQLAMLGWILAAASGLLAMCIVGATLTAALIHLNRTAIILFGVFALAAHIAPYLFFIPWFAIWIIVIIWNQ